MFSETRGPWRVSGAPLSPQCSPEACAEETDTPVTPTSHIAVQPEYSNAEFSLQPAGATLRPPHCFWVEQPGQHGKKPLQSPYLPLKACLRMSGCQWGRAVSVCVCVLVCLRERNKFSDSLVFRSGQSLFWFDLG